LASNSLCSVGVNVEREDACCSGLSCQCDIQPTDTVAVWGCGPVGQMTIRSAILLGAKQVLAIDNVPERLTMAQAGGATTINFDEESVIERLNDLTDGKGPEKCIDAVGMEAHAGGSLDAVYDKVKQTLMLATDRPHVVREMMYVCRPAAGGVACHPQPFLSHRTPVLFFLVGAALLSLSSAIVSVVSKLLGLVGPGYGCHGRCRRVLFLDALVTAAGR
jgi:hypothetical protein